MRPSSRGAEEISTLRIDIERLGRIVCLFGCDGPCVSLRVVVYRWLGRRWAA